jgi:hypothetical protein
MIVGRRGARVGLRAGCSARSTPGCPPSRRRSRGVWSTPTRPRPTGRAAIWAAERRGAGRARRADEGQRYGVYARRAEEISVYGSVDALKIPARTRRSTRSSRPRCRRAGRSTRPTPPLADGLLARRGPAPRRGPREPDGGRAADRGAPLARQADRLDPAGQALEIPEKPDERKTTPPPVAGPCNPFQPEHQPGGHGRPGACRRCPGGGSDATHTGRKQRRQERRVPDPQRDGHRVASSDEIVRVLESFGDANFMTVTGVNLSEIDRWADLAEGYSLRPGPCRPREIGVEAAYLHFWLADVVPDLCRLRVGHREAGPRRDRRPLISSRRTTRNLKG